MPHMFINRSRIHDLTRGRSDLRAQFRWETINAVVYKVGGLVFIIGSILFFPRFEAYADIGAWTFFVGSLLYLVVTVHDLAEVRRHWRASTVHDRSMIMEWTAASSYVWGTILFTAGSIFFLSAVGWYTAGAWNFIIGSGTLFGGGRGFRLRAGRLSQPPAARRPRPGRPRRRACTSDRPSRRRAAW